MTKPRLLYSPRYEATEDNPTVAGDGAQVQPHVTESLLSEFLMLLDAAQEELARRWSAQGCCDRHASRT
jgi:hypothetical protein